MRSIYWILQFIFMSNLGYPQTIGKLNLVVNEKMYVDINAIISNDSIEGFGNHTLQILPLPFELSDVHFFRCANDVKISILSEGQGYTIISVITPNSDLTKFSIMDGYKLGESPEGKSEFEFDSSFPFITNPERELFSFPFTVNSISITILFPKEFDDKEIGMSGSLFRKVDKQTYQIKTLELNDKISKTQWIVFPNPYKSKINLYQLIFALIAGFITLIIHFKAIRKRNILWILSVFILSSILVGLFIYFIVSIPKPIEIMIWASAAIPHAVLGLFGSIYILIANKFQSTLTGQVTIDNHPAQIALVRLFRVGPDGDEKTVSKVIELDERGRYTFSKWQKKGMYKYIIKAKMDMSNEIESNEIEIERGSRREIIPLNLTSLEVTHD